MSQPAASPAKALVPAPQAQVWFEEERAVLNEQVDRSFAVLLGCELVAALICAIIFAPGNGTEHAASLHFSTVLLLGVLYTAPPILLVWKRPGSVLSRHVVAVGQMLMSTLFVNVTGGRAETHFHIFGSLAFLAFYRDWRVLVTASAIISLDHLLRGWFWPESAFGTAAIDHWRWLEHTGWIIFEDAFLILSIRQIHETHQKLMLGRVELERARDAAEQASRAKDDFLAVLSHELRTPLTPSLMTLSSLVSQQNLAPELREELQLVQRNVELEARLIDDLLDLTRVASGKLQLNPAHVDVHSLLRQILQTFRGEFTAKALTVEATLEAHQHWLYGDSARLQQVFWNLLKNAMKFTPEGGHIGIRTSDANDRVKIDVSDNGVGIAPEVLPKLFRKFEQGGTEVTRQFGGLGLGLSICKAIVDLHRGAIRAESRGTGWGATFTVVLPARDAAAVPTRSGNSQTQQLRLSGKLPRRVLLVDDHVDTRNTILRLLTRAGYEVSTASSVQNALEIAPTRKFDLLVSDIGLPDGSGCDLMRELRAQYGLKGVAFSGYGMEEDVQRSLEAGFAAHLTKPVDFQRLKDAMSEALNGQVRRQVS